MAQKFDITKDVAKKRAAILQDIREFFTTHHDYTEVQTPLLAKSLIPESSIAFFSTMLDSPYRDSQQLYLVPSPEIYMKQLLAQGWGNIFQITPSFRNSEQQGKIHHNEFTMLEWYEVDIDAKTNQQRCLDLLNYLAQGRCELGKVHYLTVNEAFLRWVGVDYSLHYDDVLSFGLAMKAQGYNVDEDDSWETLFHKGMINAVEPALQSMDLVFLSDYPGCIATTAKKSADGLSYERWELYAKGIELANCYTEATEYQELATYFDKETRNATKTHPQMHAVDADLPAIFAQMPHCSGVAMGIDRLVMYLLSLPSINYQALSTL